MATCKYCYNRCDCSLYDPKSISNCPTYRHEDGEISGPQKFYVEFKEVLTKVVIIEADNELEAMDKAKEMYRKEDIVLDADDFAAPAEIRLIEDDMDPITDWESI